MKAQGQIPIRGLLRRFEDGLRDAGYCIAYRYDMMQYASEILSAHVQQHLEHLEQRVIDSVLLEQERRRANGEISERHYEKRIRCTEHFLLFAQSGKIGALPNPMRGSRQQLPSHYDELAKTFLDSLKITENARNDCRWLTRVYLGWLESEGIEKMTNISIELLQRFLLICSQRYSQNTMKDILIYLRKFHEYLFEMNLVEFDYTDLL